MKNSAVRIAAFACPHPYHKFRVHFGADGLLIISGNQTSKCLLTVISEPIRPIPIPSTRPTGSRLAKIA